MSMNEMIMVIAVTFIAVGIPIGGLVIRFALRPLVQDIAAAIRGGRAEDGAELVQRLERIEARLDEQAQWTRELLETERFYKELQAGADDQPSGS